MQNIFRFDFPNEDVCFFVSVWIFEMEQFKLKVFRFDFQPMGDFICLLLGSAIFLLSERSLSFNNAMITLTSALWSARIVELTSV